MDKEESLKEIMKKDEESGIYKQLTAVDWLVEQLDNTTIFSKYVFLEIIEQAKAMEKEQIIEAIKFGDLRGKLTSYLTAEDYYNETYKLK